MPGRRSVLRAAGYALAWLLVALPAWAWLFTHTSASMVVASHDAVITPAFSGEIRLDMGPYLPDLRTDSGTWVGLDVEMRKTRAVTTPELAQRYAAIAARPEAEAERIGDEVFDIARNTAIPAAVIGLVPIALWLLVGSRRRADLLRSRKRDALAAVTVVAVIATLGLQPWRVEPDPFAEEVWLPVQDAVPELDVPAGLRDWEVQGGLITANTQRLLNSMFDSYDKSKVFYSDIVDRVDEVADDLRRPEEGETVAVLVADRHDNIGMDKVVRALADEVGTTAVLDAGDDTSTGEPWEAFSLDSLDAAFKDYEHRIFVAGNHDHGDFVRNHLRDLGWTHLDSEPVEAFGTRIIGVDDPRSSGLGNWRDATDLGFGEVRDLLADEVCRLDEEGDRVATVLVHDANLAKEALARGCTDLVLGGHVHVQIGPTRVVGENGKVGYTYTNGTTGGAAYAIAIGSKLRRAAQFTFVTYRDGRPVGIQPVNVQTTGDLSASDYIPLDLGDETQDSSRGEDEAEPSDG